MSGSSLLTIGMAVQCLRQGRVIAYPTEAVYGLGCDPADESAVHQILQLKSRPASMGLILIASHFDQVKPYIRQLGKAEQEQALSAWPGPVSWLIERAPDVPDWLAGKHETIAVRVTAHPVCRALCEAFGGAIVSTSANPSAREAARTAAEVAAYFNGKLCGIVEGELGVGNQPSEIRDLASGRIIRHG